MVNPWHDVDPGKSPWKEVNGIIEIPQGGRNKYELDKDTGLLRLVRVLYASMYYPINYGIIPRTVNVDGDPLDILVLSSLPIEPRTIVTAKPIGIMRMVDRDEQDDKVLAVCCRDMGVEHYTTPQDLPPHLLTEIDYFFENYTRLEGKTVVVPTFEGPDAAVKAIDDARKRYKKQYGKGK